METPLALLDYARRARRVYGEREAVIDGDSRPPKLRLILSRLPLIKALKYLKVVA